MTNEAHNFLDRRSAGRDYKHLAHRAFDPLWERPDGMTQEETRLLLARNHAYQLLAVELGVTEENFRMDRMPLPLAMRVPAAVERIKRRLALRTPEEIDRDYKRRGHEISLNRKGLSE